MEPDAYLYVQMYFLSIFFFFYIFIVWTLMFLQVSPIIHMQNKKGGRERTCSLTFGKELHL